MYQRLVWLHKYWNDNASGSTIIKNNISINYKFFIIVSGSKQTLITVYSIQMHWPFIFFDSFGFFILLNCFFIFETRLIVLAPLFLRTAICLHIIHYIFVQSTADSSCVQTQTDIVVAITVLHSRWYHTPQCPIDTMQFSLLSFIICVGHNLA